MFEELVSAEPGRIMEMIEWLEDTYGPPGLLWQVRRAESYEYNWRRAKDSRIGLDTMWQIFSFTRRDEHVMFNLTWLSQGASD